MRGITPQQISDGLNKIPDRQDSWPPNAKEFRQMCLPEGIAPRDKKGTGNSDAYLGIHDSRHSMNRPARTEYGESDRKLLTGTKYISNRKKAGRRELDAMLTSLADVKTKDEIGDEE